MFNPDDLKGMPRREEGKVEVVVDTSYIISDLEAAEFMKEIEEVMLITHEDSEKVNNHLKNLEKEEKIKKSQSYKKSNQNHPAFKKKKR